MPDRRRVLAIAGGSAMAVGIGGGEAARAATRRLVLVHGRAQQGRTEVEIRTEWLAALGRGAIRLGRTLPAALEVTLPFYGDTLDGFARAYDLPLTTDIKTRGGRFDAEFLEFQAAVADALRRRAGVTDAEVDAEYGPNPKARGPQNWEWVHAILRALDKRFGGLGQTALETFTRDVFLYVRRAGVRDEIDRIVGQAFDERPAVVVGHSLGSVVAFNLLRRDPRPLAVPLLVTVGSPLGIRAIRDELRPLRRPAAVEVWRNAFDERDVVALYPLDGANFPVSPPIENHAEVANPTPNRHGVTGYLEDPTVAGWILDALVA